MRTLIYAVLIFCLSLISIELWARSPHSEALLLSESYGFEQSYFGQRLADLDHLQKTEPFNCVIMGSSVVFNGIENTLVEASYSQHAKAPLKCVHFGIPSLYFNHNSVMANVIVKRYKPQLIIIGVSLRDMLRYPWRIEETNAIVPWTRYLQGKMSIQGFLTHHLASYRHLQQYTGWYDADFHLMVRDYESHLSADQFLNMPSAPNFWDSVKTYPHPGNRDSIPFDQNIQEFEILMAQDDLPMILLLEMPISSTFIAKQVDGMVLYQDFLQTLQALATRYYLPFWQTSYLDILTGEDWRDDRHLSVKNAENFSLWLGEQLGRATQTGIWERPLNASYRDELPPVWSAPEPYNQDFRDFEPVFGADLLFNPNTLLDENVSMIQALLDELKANPDLTEAQTAPIFSAIWAFHQMRYADNFPQVTNDPRFEEWRKNEFLPESLLELGIRYLIFSDQWLSWTSEQAYANLMNPNDYRLVQTLDLPTSTYFIYEIRG